MRCKTGDCRLVALRASPLGPRAACGLFAQSASEAKTFYNAKILALRKNVDELQPVIERKQDNLRSVVDVLQHRLTQRERTRWRGGCIAPA